MKKILFSSFLLFLSVKAMDEIPVRGGSIKSDKIPDRFKSSQELGLSWVDIETEADEQKEKKQKEEERKERIRAQWKQIIEILQDKREQEQKIQKENIATRKSSERVPTPHPDVKPEKTPLSYAAVVAGKKGSISEEEQSSQEVELRVIKKKKK